MATLAVYNSHKEKVGELTLAEAVFGVEPKVGVLHEVVQWQLAKRRSGNASTKGRSDVRGGGRKPWRQKGTGRARSGSNTSPIWRHGGVAFGPKPRDYGYSLPKKVRRLALRMALTSKVQAERMLVVRDFGLEEIRTKNMADLLKRFDVTKAVIITEEPDKILELSARNIPFIKVLPRYALNVYDLLKYEHIILHEPAVSRIEEKLLP